MHRRLVVGIYRWAFGLLGFAALVVGIARRVVGDGVSAFDYFSYFTILSNLLAAAVLLYGAWPWTGRVSWPYDMVRGAATVYMVITGLVYGLLLAHYPVEVPAWVNDVEHRILPVLMAVDWLLDPPRHRLPVRRALLWLAFPIGYVVYSELRGAFTGWYPYPFLDPGAGGYGRVAGYVAGIAVAFVLAALAVSQAANRLGSVRQVSVRT